MGLKAEVAALRVANDGLRRKLLEMERLLCESTGKLQLRLAEREADLAECRTALAAYSAQEAGQLKARIESMNPKLPVPAPG